MCAGRHTITFNLLHCTLLSLRYDSYPLSLSSYSSLIHCRRSCSRSRLTKHGCQTNNLLLLKESRFPLLAPRPSNSFLGQQTGHFLGQSIGFIMSLLCFRRSNGLCRRLIPILNFDPMFCASDPSIVDVPTAFLASISVSNLPSPFY